MKKLQNKKTGEIGELCITNDVYEVAIRECMKSFTYNTLAELNKEWEDYETREGFKQFIKLNKCFVVGFYDEESSTKELEKAKAWQRLKDKGFKFTGYDLYSGSGAKDKTEGEFAISAECSDFVGNKDLDLLFGGEDA